MTVELSKEAQAFVQAQLATGDYADESEVVARALELWQRYQQQTAEIRASVEAGRKAAEEGRGTLISSPEEGEAFAHRLLPRRRSAAPHVRPTRGNGRLLHHRPRRRGH